VSGGREGGTGAKGSASVTEGVMLAGNVKYNRTMGWVVKCERSSFHRTIRTDSPRFGLDSAHPNVTTKENKVALALFNIAGLMIKVKDSSPRDNIFFIADSMASFKS